MGNKYQKWSYFFDRKYKEILRLFSEDLSAVQTSNITNISRSVINRVFMNIRKNIAKYCEKSSKLSAEKIELDESYFGVKRLKGVRGRDVRGKVPVFGILKRGDKVYTQIVKNCSAKELLPIIEELAYKESVIYTDCWKSYDGLVDYGYKQHYKVRHSTNQFADGRNHIKLNHKNGIENFWDLCKVRLSKFRGISKDTFYLHLKECEFRYNNRNKTYKELYLYVSKLIRKNNNILI